MSDDGMAAVLVTLTDRGDEPGPDAMHSTPPLSPERQRISALRELVSAQQRILRETIRALDDLDVVAQAREIDG